MTLTGPQCRQRERTGPAQGADDELLGVSGMGRVQKRRHHDGLDGRPIGCRLRPDPDVHWSVLESALA